MKSGDVSRARINAAAPGAFEAARAASTGGTTRTSASPAIVASRANPLAVGQRPERARLRHAHRPVRIRVEARERGGEGFGIDARQRAHRRAANGRGAVGHELHEDVGRAGIGQRRQRGHRLEPYRGIRRAGRRRSAVTSGSDARSPRAASARSAWIISALSRGCSTSARIAASRLRRLGRGQTPHRERRRVAPRASRGARAGPAPRARSPTRCSA